MQHYNQVRERALICIINNKKKHKELYKSIYQSDKVVRSFEKQSKRILLTNQNKSISSSFV